MRILFINPSGGYLYHEYPPLGILYVASYLRKCGHTVSFFEEAAFPENERFRLIDFIDRFRPETLAFSLWTTNLNHTYETIKFLKNKYPSVIIVVGGAHATALPRMTLQECPAIDFIVYGEGEITMLELVNAIEKASNFDSIDGIYYRSKGDIFNTKPRRLVDNLDDLPFPAYDLSKNFHYRFDPIIKRKSVATIMTSRGCPYNCTFCSKSIFGSTYRKRSPQNVVTEIIYQINSLGAAELYFMDDLFTSDRAWLDSFYNELEKNNINLPWKCLSRVRGLDLNDYIKMKRYGCYVIQFGVESGNDLVLKNMGKYITKPDCVKAFSQAQKAGLNTYGFFIFGHRDDTRQAIKDTLEFAKQLNPDFVAFFTLIPFPGTAAYNFVEDKLKSSWERIRYVADGLRQYPPISICSISPQDLVRYENDANFEFYGRWGYFFRNIIFSRTEPIMKILKLKYFIYHYLRLIKYHIKGQRIFIFKYKD